ncbi:hypothetical protein AB4Y43_01565 [Paraburkholderia sp. BR10872]|uniref:hypothetical protein n=1 Tax=Paraburkholderia sp. BR10872 TaxID=3236989 RepID=UPI0034D2840B
MFGIFGDDADWDDEYDPTEYEAQPAYEGVSVQKCFGCILCHGQIMLLIPYWERHMKHMVACACGAVFQVDPLLADHEWRGPTHDGPTTAPSNDTKPRENHVRDAVEANR